jgi:hypothetical protein
LSYPYPVLSYPYPVLSYPYPVLSYPYPVLKTPYQYSADDNDEPDVVQFSRKVTIREEIKSRWKNTCDNKGQISNIVISFMQLWNAECVQHSLNVGTLLLRFVLKQNREYQYQHN